MDAANGFTSVNGYGPSPTTSIPPSTAGTKRKRSTGAAKFYAVRIGKSPGIYHSWAECLDQVRGYPKAQFKSFTSLTDAQAFVKGDENGGGAQSGGGSKFYGVKEGRNPGVYTSWPEVLEQITGWKGPKHKVFKTRSEAEMFVAEGRKDPGPISMVNGDSMIESIEESDSTPAKKAAKTSSKSKKVKDDPETLDPLEAGGGGEYSPGSGPLPEGAEDNFDPTITLDQSLGTARYKTASELSKTKYQASAPIKDSPVRIYTDGSALSNGMKDNNGKSTAIGGVGVYFGPLDRRNVSEPLTGTKQTNQRAELTALLRALEVGPRDRKIVIYSDSHYAIKCVTEWFLKWRSNNWHNASNKPVENKDLVTKVIDALEERQRLNRYSTKHPNMTAAREEIKDFLDVRAEANGFEVDVDGEARQHWDRGPASVKFVWVKGHSKDEGNNAADELAVNGARTARELGEDVVLD